MKPEKILVLEREVQNIYNVPAIYQTDVVLGWYLDGYTCIQVYEERKRAFLYFAAVSGLLVINSHGIAYVAGMKII